MLRRLPGLVPAIYHLVRRRRLCRDLDCICCHILFIYLYYIAVSRCMKVIRVWLTVEVMREELYGHVIMRLDIWWDR